MARPSKISENVQNEVLDVISELGLDRFVDFHIMNLGNQKTMIKITKASATNEYLLKSRDVCLVYIDEEIWDMVSDKDMRKLIILNALNGVHFDDEKNTLKVAQPEMLVSMECYAKFGDELVKAITCSYMAKKTIEDEDKKKAEKEAKKGKKKNGQQQS